MSDVKISRDNDDIRKVLWYLKQVSSLAEDNNSIGSIASSVTTNEVEKMERTYVFKYSLKRSEKVKIYQQKHRLNVVIKVKPLFVSDLLFQWLVVFAIGCNISFNDWKGHGLRVYPPAMFGSTI